MTRAVKAKKHLGQHFLINEGIAIDISNLILNKQIKNVLEIGPGMGVLTKNLLKESVKLKIVEIDPESIEYLKKKYPEVEKNIINDDFLKLDLNNMFSSNFSIIGNWTNSNSKVLDLGCGDGGLLNYLKYRKNIKGFGIEKNPENWLLSLKNNIDVIQMDLEAGLAGFETKSFDFS